MIYYSTRKPSLVARRAHMIAAAALLSGVAGCAPKPVVKTAPSTTSPSPFPTPAVAIRSTAPPGAGPMAHVATPLPPAPMPGAAPPSITATPAPPVSTTSAATTTIASAPSPTPEPIVIPTAHGRMAPVMLDAGKTIPIIFPKDIKIARLRRGDPIEVVVDDDGTPFSSGADAAMEKGVRLRGTIESASADHVQFLFHTAIDGAGNRYPMIGALTTTSGGGLPQWLQEAEEARHRKANARLETLEKENDQERDADRDAMDQARSHDAERAGDLKSMGVVLPWAMGSKGLMIAGASYLITKATDKVRADNEAHRKTARNERETARTTNEAIAKDEIIQQLSQERLKDAIRAARSTLRTDMERGARAGVTLMFVFSSDKSIQELDKELHQ